MPYSLYITWRATSLYLIDWVIDWLLTSALEGLELPASNEIDRRISNAWPHFSPPILRRRRTRPFDQRT